MATAVAAAKTARSAANGGNSSFSPSPGGGSTRLCWLPPGPVARDGRAAILQERRPRLPVTCAPIGGRQGRRYLVTVSIAPARGVWEAGGRLFASCGRRGLRGCIPGQTRGRGELREIGAQDTGGGRRCSPRGESVGRRTPPEAGARVEGEE